jgi:divalent metal cation (Fe/Co/Zn/Cd) transporter
VQQVVNDLLGAKACHRIQARRSDAGWSVSMHCYLPAEIPLTEGHRISTRLEMQLLSKVRGLERVMIHTEPHDDDRV